MNKFNLRHFTKVITISIRFVRNCTGIAHGRTLFKNEFKKWIINILFIISLASLAQ
jgi:hypothetical protein